MPLTPTVFLDALILGAGASGLMCAATAASAGKKVLILDHASHPARKLSITGGGKGNITNKNMGVQHFFGENPQFCRSALAQFSPASLLALLTDANIPFEEREEGEIFCQHSIEEVITLLLDRCEPPLLDTFIESVTHTAADVHTPSPYFTVTTETNVYHAKALVIATGGPAAPHTGATDFGMRLARQFGHRVVQPRPALVGLTMPHTWPLMGLAGISCRVSITLAETTNLPITNSVQLALKQSLPPKNIAAINLPLLFTHKGISGPAALQTSLYWQPNQEIYINFLPQASLKSLMDSPEAGKNFTYTILKRFLPDRLCEALIPPALGKKKIAELSRQDRNFICESIHAHTITPTGTEGMRKAEVTTGGVSTEDISSSTLESKRTANLFFCGEVLDITGRLGGYNLHWAFASGHLTGISI